MGRRRADEVASVAGAILRDLRLRRRMSLREVNVRSEGAFKPSTVASYERGERQISLERLFALAQVYAAAPERIVAAIAARLAATDEAEHEPEVIVDLSQPLTPRVRPP